LDISFFDPFDLSLPNHVHHFVAMNGPPGGRVGTKPEARLNSALDEPVVYDFSGSSPKIVL
jgi:hypothetical protein